MSSSLGRLQVDLEARIAKFESDMGRAARILQRDMVNAARSSERAMQQMRVSAQRDMERIRASTRQATAAVVAFFSVQQGIRAAAGLGRIADEYSNIQAKVRLAAGENGNLTASFEKIFALAQRTFNSLDGTAALVQRGAQALRSFGQEGSQAFGNALQLAEIFNKALVVSGAKQEEATAAAQQFSQALASGKFNGDEFRSVMENNSRFAQLLADSLGVNIAQLRDMSKEGKLTTTTFLALIGNTGKLDAEFAKMPLTIGRAKQQLDNAFTKFIGEADHARGVSRSFATAIAGLAQNLGPVVSGLGSLAVVAAGAFAGRSLQAARDFTRSVLAQAEASRIAASAARERSLAEAQVASQALLRARAEQVSLELSARAAVGERARVESLIAVQNAQIATIRANGLRATSEIELARLSQQLSAAELARAQATTALGIARQKEVALNAQLAASNRTLAAAQVTAGVAGATAGQRITLGMRAASAATAAMTVASRALAAGVAALGGPVGIAIAGIALLAVKMAGASAEAEQLRSSALSAARGLAELNRESSAQQILDAGSAALAKQAELTEQIEKDEKKLLQTRLASKVALAGGLAGLGALPGNSREAKQAQERLDHNRAALAEVNRQLAKTSVLASQYTATQTAQAAATGGVSEELTKEADRLKAQRIELTQGLKARLEYEAVKREGVKDASQLNAATRETIDNIVREQGAIDGVKDARRGAAREARSDAAAAKREAADRTRAQEQFRRDVERLSASMGGEFAQANATYQASLRDIREEYERGGASTEDYRRQQDLLKQQFEQNVDSIRAAILGPMAQATLEYERALERMHEDAAAIGVTSDDVAAAQKRMGRQFAESADQIRRQEDPVGSLLDDMRFELDLLGQTNAARTAEIELRRIGVGLSAEERAAAKSGIEAMAQEREAMAKRIETMDNLRHSFEDIIQQVAKGQMSLIDGLKAFADAFVAELLRMAAAQASISLFGEQGTTGGGFIGGFIQKLLGAGSSAPSFGIPLPSSGRLLGFAGGGNPPVNSPYIVGEDGPEVRIDRAPGTIIPTDMLGGTQITQINNFTIPRRFDNRSQMQVAQANERMGRAATVRNGG